MFDKSGFKGWRTEATPEPKCYEDSPQLHCSSLKGRRVEERLSLKLHEEKALLLSLQKEPFQPELSNKGCTSHLVNSSHRKQETEAAVLQHETR